MVSSSQPDLTTYPTSLGDIWRAVFGPDDPRAGEGPEQLEKQVRNYCKSQNLAEDAKDLVAGANDASETGKSKSARLRQERKRGVKEKRGTEGGDVGGRRRRKK